MFKYANTMHRRFNGRSLQSGSALIFALVFLVAMTLIGTTAMLGTSQQEKMAGNMRDRNLAFQAAEAALLVGERLLDPTPPPESSFNNTGTNVGLRVATDPDHNNNSAYWSDSYSWDDNNSRLLSANTLSGLTNQPRYVIEELKANTACGGFTPPARCFRITARSTGGTTDAVVILQSTYLVP